MMTAATMTEERDARMTLTKFLLARIAEDETWSRLVAVNAILKALALPYADHAEYRDEWRP